MRDKVIVPYACPKTSAAEIPPHSSNATSTDALQASGNVVNLSSYNHSHDEVSLLSRGLNFCPSKGGYSEYEVMKDLETFARNLRLREFFLDKNSDNSTTSILPSHTHWTPPTQRDKCLDLSITAVQRDVLEMYHKQPSFNKGNLSPNEKVALERLKSCNDIVIKPADKGGAVVLLNKVDYVGEALRQLDDSTFYQRLDDDPTKNFKLVITTAITDLIDQQKIPASALHALISLSPIAGRFYLLPKIHKSGNPGRGIVSVIGTVTELISQFVDSLINQIPPCLPSYIKDTNHFLSDIVDFPVPPGSLLVTLDVASLYTNIPHAGGISAVLHSYNESVCDKSIDSSTLRTLLGLVLELNNFEFNGVHYLQINGTSMGTPIGPTYANISMGVLENEFLASRSLGPTYYKRYIDDIFMIWHHGEAQLLSFIHDLNTANPSILFRIPARNILSTSST